MPRANGARVARNLGRLFSQLPLSAASVNFSTSASYRIGASNQTGGSFLFWLRFDGFVSAVTPIRPINIVDGGNLVGLYLFGSTPQMIVNVNGGAVAVNESSGYQIPLKKLVCYVFTWDASGLVLYADGVPVWTKAVDARPAFGATPRFVVGNWIVSTLSAGGEVGGEVYLFNRKLTKGEVEAHYFDGEVPSAPVSAWGPTGWPAMTGNTVTLTGGSGNNGTITSGTLMNEPAERKPALATRQRAGSRFQQITAGTSVGGWVIADHATLKPASFTIEARVRSDAWAAGSLGVNGIGASNYRGIIVKTSVVNWNDGWGLIEVANAPTGQKTLRLFVGSYSNGTTFLVSPHTKELHVLATYDGATARMYVDGELVSTWAAGVVAQVAQPIRIGHGYAAGAAGGYALEGSVRDVRYYSRVLTADEARARFQDDIDAPGMIAAWDLRESRRQSFYNNIVGVVAKDRVGGFDAVWTNGTYGADADDIGARRAPRRKNIERVNIPWLSGSAMSALDASMVIGAGSFSVAGTFRIHSWNVNVNTLIIVSDNASYANGFVLTYSPFSEAGVTITGYLASAGPNAYGSTAGRVTIQRYKSFRLVFVADATTSKTSWYIDGVRLSEVTVAAWNLPNTPRFAVGLNIALPSATGCQAADMRYAVGRAWTKEEIEADAAGVDDALSGVTHAWPMDEQAASSTSMRATKGSSPLVLTNAAAIKPDALAYDYFVQDKLTNKLPSQNFLDTTVWVNKGAATSRAANGVDLWGDAAYTFTGSNVSSAFAVEQQVPAPQLGRRMRFEMDLKYDNNAWIALTGNTGGTTAYFNIQTGAVGTAGNALAKEITPLGSGWYRCAIEYIESDAISGGSGGGSVRLYFAFADGTVVGNANGKNITVGRQSVFMAENGRAYNEDLWTPALAAQALVAWYDPRQLVTLNGTDVSALGNRGTESRSISQATPANQPAYVSAGGVFGGPEYPHIAFTSANNDRLESAASWSFLHDGTGMCIAVRYRATSTGGHLIDTCNASPANVGITLLHDGAGARAQIVIANGSGAYLANLQTNASSVANDTAHTLIAWWKKGAPREVGIAVDGVVLSTVAASLAPSAAAPSFNMGVGRRASAANALQGEIGQLVLLRTAPDSVMIARLHQFLVTPPG